MAKCKVYVLTLWDGEQVGCQLNTNEKVENALDLRLRCWYNWGWFSYI